MKGEQKRGIIMREIAVSFKKTVTSWNFWLCVGASIVMLFISQIYEDYDTKNRYSVINALLSFSTDEMKQHMELCNRMVINAARGSWFSLFAPLIAAFCFIPGMCAEREENALRFQVFRSSKTKWQLSTYLTGIISGGTAVTLGYVIFLSITMLLFPDVSEMEPLAAEIVQGRVPEIYQLILEMWLFTIFWSIPSMFLTSVLRNKYLIMCIPFFLKYALTQLSNKLLTAPWTEGYDQNLIIIQKYIDPDGLLIITSTKYYDLFIMYGILFAASLAAYIIIQRKRGDFCA